MNERLPRSLFIIRIYLVFANDMSDHLYVAKDLFYEEACDNGQCLD